MDARVRNNADAERELIIRRTFDAPRELRVGGAFSACMRSPEGTEHRLRGVYREIVPPERLVFTHCWVDERGTPGPETLVTVILAERGGRTEMMFHQGLFASIAARDGHEQGWTSCFEQLAELLG